MFSISSFFRKLKRSAPLVSLEDNFDLWIDQLESNTDLKNVWDKKNALHHGYKKFRDFITVLKNIYILIINEMETYDNSASNFKKVMRNSINELVPFENNFDFVPYHSPNIIKDIVQWKINEIVKENNQGGYRKKITRNKNPFVMRAHSRRKRNPRSLCATTCRSKKK